MEEAKDLTPEEEELEIIMNREDRELIESRLEMGTGHQQEPQGSDQGEDPGSGGE